MDSVDGKKDPLLGNKIAAACLTALLIFFGLQQLGKALYSDHPIVDHDGKMALAYPIEIETTAGPKEEKPVDLGTLLANANVKSGEKKVAICKSCHNLTKDGPNSTGPDLWGVVGRPVASHEGFSYTAALKDFGGNWTYERLFHFIENSKAYVPGTAMSQNIRKPEQRADILAYLQTLSDNPVPFPEPAPAEAPASDEGAATDGAAKDGSGDAPADQSQDGEPQTNGDGHN